MPMGPLRLIDEVGVDIAADVSQTLAAAFPSRLKVPRLLAKMTEAGLFGKKSGAGFYLYAEKEARPNPGAAALREQSRPHDRAGLQEKMVLSMVNEAARCLEEKVVDRADDVDFAMVMGTGWAPFRGGPLRYADSLGIATVTERLERLAGDGGNGFTPCALLADMANNGRRFYENEPGP
jgi:3-hydroxyacyl-CoA dehydrogenase/enoyl-CoA hydratase/3-hydroxybutyryl-CoA epimerase